MQSGQAAGAVTHQLTVPFNQPELTGFRRAAEARGVTLLDFVSMTDRRVPRLFRIGAYPPLRGMLMELDERSHVLYTRGSVSFYATYPGQYVPRPLLFRCDDTVSAPAELAREILALSKMNWNATEFDGGSPITVEAARSVSG